MHKLDKYKKGVTWMMSLSTLRFFKVSYANMIYWRDLKSMREIFTLLGDFIL